jgi:hypothetical protein
VDHPATIITLGLAAITFAYKVLVVVLTWFLPRLQGTLTANFTAAFQAGMKQADEARQRDHAQTTATLAHIRERVDDVHAAVVPQPPPAPEKAA